MGVISSKKLQVVLVTHIYQIIDKRRMRQVLAQHFIQIILP